MAAPKLRFKNVNGTNYPNWKSSKLSDLAKIFDGTHMTPDYKEQGVPFYSVENLTGNNFTNTKYIAEEVFEKECKRVRLQKGDVLMTRIGDIGTPKYIDWDVRASFYVSLALLKQSDRINSRYLSHYIAAPLFQRELHQRIIHVAFPKKINLGEIGECSVSVPAEGEQTKIANFLTAVDEKISHLTRKCDLLAQYKKGLMQKIFSQEIRFKDDEGRDFPEWEESIIGDVLTIGSGKDYKHLTSGPTPVYGTGGYMLSVNDHLYDGESVCIGRKGTIDKPMLLTGKFWTVDTLFYTHTFKNCIPRYIYAYFQMIDWKSYNEASGVPSLSKSTIEKIQIQVPSVDEQTKIANFLSAIDDKISATQSQLAAMKQWKQGLLQQMFV